VVAFTFAQTGNLGLGFLAAGAAIELKRACRGQPFAKAIFQAWRLGRQANWLPALDYERLFAEPLELARARLKITIPRIYHAIPPAARNAYRYPPDQVLDDTWAPERQSPHKKAA
jgi:ubiquinone biosynthesis protein COQ4